MNKEYEQARARLIQWVADYKIAAECRALAETPEESADYLLSWLAVKAEDQAPPELPKLAEKIARWLFSKRMCSYTDIFPFPTWDNDPRNIKRFAYEEANSILALIEEVPKELKVLENIGDYIDLDVEASYPCSDGSVTTTISVDKLLQAQVNDCNRQIKEE